MIEDAVPLVLFSGGVDSTYLLYKTLKEYKKVRVISAALTIQTEKSIRETDARQLILDELHQMRGEDPTIGEVRIGHTACIHDGQTSVTALCQPLHWITLATAYSLPNTNEVRIGYVKDDGPYTDNKNFQALWKAACVVTGCRSQDGQPPLLTFPLANMTKDEIIQAIPSRLLRFTTWCEDGGTLDACGYCSPCRRMKKAIFKLNEDNSLDEEKSDLMRTSYRRMTGDWLPNPFEQNEVKEEHEKDDNHETET